MRDTRVIAEKKTRRVTTCNFSRKTSSEEAVVIPPML